MSYINKSVSINGTEIEFIKAFVNELTSADSRITCETDIDAEFANEDTYTPTIILNVNNCYKIKLKRGGSLSTLTNNYYISLIVNDKENNSVGFVFSAQRNVYSSVATRAFNFMFMSNDNAIAILFGGYNQSLPTTYSYNVMSYHEQEFNVVAYNSTIIASKSEFIRTDESNKNETYKTTNRLIYSRDEDVEIIESKPLLQNNSVVYDMKNIYDCSNVLAGNILLIDSNRYFAIDSNTLIKI